MRTDAEEYGELIDHLFALDLIIISADGIIRVRRDMKDENLDHILKEVRFGGDLGWMKDLMKNDVKKPGYGFARMVVDYNRRAWRDNLEYGAYWQRNIMELVDSDFCFSIDFHLSDFYTLLAIEMLHSWPEKEEER